MTPKPPNRKLPLVAAACGLIWLATPALACGPGMGGGGGPPPSGGGHPGQGSDSGSGSYSNSIGAEGMREGAAAAAGGEGQGEGPGVGSGPSDPSGGPNPALTSSIAAVAAAQSAPGGGGLPPVWCLMQRIGPDNNREQTVIRCDNEAGAGPGWTPVASNLTFTEASTMRDTFNAANQPTVWCVMQRGGPGAGREETVIRCDDMAGAGPGWTPIASNLTFAAASAIRDSR